jgi:hypothetical protein
VFPYPVWEIDVNLSRAPPDPVFIAPGVHEARWIAVKLERAMKATLGLSASGYALQST